jgi:transposase
MPSPSRDPRRGRPRPEPLPLREALRVPARPLPGQPHHRRRGQEHQDRKVISRVATALRRAAQSAANSRSALGGFYRRLRARLGPAKAITATAHKLARIFYFYRMWKSREPYHPLSLDHYETKYRERTLASLRKRAAALGFELV